MMLGRAGSDDHLGQVAHIDWPSVARGDKQQADIGNAGQRAAGDGFEHRAVLAQLSGEE